MKKFLLILVAVVGFGMSGYAQEQLMRLLKQAETAEERGNYPNAIKLYEEVIDLKPDYADAYYSLARICEKMKTKNYLEQAIKSLKKYILLVPDEKSKINEKIWELEYIVSEMKEIDDFEKDLLGLWKTTSYNYATGQPDGVIEISSFQGQLRVKLLESSKIFSTTLTNIVSTTQVFQDETFQKNLLFSYTDSKTRVSDPGVWGKILKMGGQILGGTTGVDVTMITDPLGNALESTPGQKTEAKKFHDFCITHFGKDTLKGLVWQFASQEDAKTKNLTILWDDVTPVQFVRGGNYYELPKKQQQPKTPKIIHYDSLKIVTTLGFSGVFSLFEKPRQFKNHPLNFGGAMNLDFTFILRKSCPKKTKHGFTMGFELLMEGAGIDHSLYEYYINDYDWKKWEYHHGLGWNVRYTIGWAGMTKISDKACFNWGIKPIGFHFSGYGWSQSSKLPNTGYSTSSPSYYNSPVNYYPKPWGVGICGSLDLGFGFQASKKCIISPFLRCSYALDFRAKFLDFKNVYTLSVLGADLGSYRPVSIFPFTVQAGLSFNFLGYHKTKAPKQSKSSGTEKAARIGDIFRSLKF